MPSFTHNVFTATRYYFSTRCKEQQMQETAHPELKTNILAPQHSVEPSSGWNV